MQLLTTVTSYTMHVTRALLGDTTESHLSEADSSFRLRHSLQFGCVYLSGECLVLHIINKK
jgi:hypothetical protein